jgi:glycosyltransferase involved in cell wall biosynthesis
MRVLYFCEGFTDIRFVVGLSEICDLTLAVPERQYRESGLAERITESRARLKVDTIEGGRLAFQARSFLYLVRQMRTFDVVLSQEMGRGSLNATVIGWVLGVPVVTYLGTSPIEYFQCRRQRGQIGQIAAMAGEVFLRVAMTVSGRLGTAVLTTGPYLRDMAAAIPAPAYEGYYCGIDTTLFKPVTPAERAVLRKRHQLPQDRFLVLFSSRISHEKDPETVLRAVWMARERGLDAVAINLGGGFEEFVNIARALGLPDVVEWIVARPAVHPMKDLCEYVQAADLVVQASLAEGGGMSPLEAVACGTPAVATAVGGLALTLKGIAQLTPRRDAGAMCEAILWVAQNGREAGEQALRGRAFVEATWSRDRAFETIRHVLSEACVRPS